MGVQKVEQLLQIELADLDEKWLRHEQVPSLHAQARSHCILLCVPGRCAGLTDFSAGRQAEEEEIVAMHVCDALWDELLAGVLT